MMNERIEKKQNYQPPQNRHRFRFACPQIKVIFDSNKQHEKNHSSYLS